MKKLISLFVLSFVVTGIAYAQTTTTYLKNYQYPVPAIKVDTSAKGLRTNERSVDKIITNKLENDRAAALALSSANTVYSTMPVARSTGRNTDLMPVVKPGNKDTYYTMLVKRIRSVKPTLTVPQDNQEVNINHNKNK